MSQVTLEGYILVPESDLAAVTAALPTPIELTLQEPGCLVFQVQQSPNNPNRFDVFEVFTDRSAFALHQRRVGESDWGRITLNVERVYQVSG